MFIVLVFLDIRIGVGDLIDRIVLWIIFIGVKKLKGMMILLRFLVIFCIFDCVFDLIF